MGGTFRKKGVEMEFSQIAERNSLVNIFDSASKTKNGIQAWQSIASGHDKSVRDITKFLGLKVDLNQNHIELTPRDTDKSIVSNAPLYFVANYRYMIFKSRVIFNSPHKVIIEFPEMVLIKNSRREDRQFPHTKEFEFKLNMNDNYSKIFSKKIIDYSEEGMAISITPTESILFEKNAIIETIDLTKKFVISHMTTLFKDERSSGVRVGLKRLK